MIPIQDLLNRIRWDEAFGRGAFSIGYLDRVAARIVRVPLSDVRTVKVPLPALEAVQPDGRVQTIPLHRVREVWRDGELVWERQPPDPDG